MRPSPPRPLRAALALFLALAPWGPRPESVHAQEGPADLFRFRSVAPGVWVSVTREGLNPSAYANALVVVGDSAVLVVDTHHSRAAGRRLAEDIRRVTRLPVRWVVNTHVHGDHVWGNYALAERWPEARFVAHPATIEAMVTDSDRALAEEVARLDRLVARLEAALADGGLPDDAVPVYRAALARYRLQRQEVADSPVFLPDVPVADDLTVSLGGREVRILHPGPAHTPGDLAVWVPDVEVMAVGDLVEEGALWLEGADVRGWARALARLRTFEPDRVVPGHGRLRDDARLLEAHAAFLVEALALVGAGMPSSSRDLARVLSRHQEALEPYGLTPSAFEGYVEAVRDAMSGRR